MKKSIAKHAETVEDNETINTNWTDTSPSQNDVFLFWQNTLDLAAERVADIEEMYPDTPWYEAGEEAVVSVTSLFFPTLVSSIPIPDYPLYTADVRRRRGIGCTCSLFLPCSWICLYLMACYTKNKQSDLSIAVKSS